jgi:hypothetical protein
MQKQVNDQIKTVLSDEVKVGKVDNVQVKVNVPENIVRTGILKQALEYLVSRITTMVVNRSRDSITQSIGGILTDSIRANTAINP